MQWKMESAPEVKFHAPEAGLSVTDGHVIAGYASLFGVKDQGNDIVQKGAYAASLARLAAAGRGVKMLWQHDPAQPIGVWDEVREDAAGLWVKGRILTDVARGADAAALLAAGAIDGLSIGYRTIKAQRGPDGARALHELDLWEVSLVTFPMQAEARITAKSALKGADWAELAALFDAARAAMAAPNYGRLHQRGNAQSKGKLQ